MGPLPDPCSAASSTAGFATISSRFRMLNANHQSKSEQSKSSESVFQLHPRPTGAFGASEL